MLVSQNAGTICDSARNEQKKDMNQSLYSEISGRSADQIASSSSGFGISSSSAIASANKLSCWLTR
jgi:hypothetical protein